ncbi:MAG: hypothetical protein RI894_1470 [Bacteroidota bacterium]
MQLHTINTGFFKLDGGAMFGVVPKSMWHKLNAPDENNMCRWAMRCLLVQTDDKRNILIDTGLGDKQDAKFRSHFYPHGSDTLLNSLAQKGLQPDDITDVVLTHFHFDHVGGAVKRNDKNEYLPTFPKAKYWTNDAHYAWAFAPNPREKASFLKENFVPLFEHGVLQQVEVQQGMKLFDNFYLDFAFGHTEALINPRITVGDKTVFYCADLLASAAHIGLPYVMSYDIRPLQTMKEKDLMLRQAAEQSWILYLEHDPVNECCTVRLNEKGQIVLDKTMTLAEALGFKQ